MYLTAHKCVCVCVCVYSGHCTCVIHKCQMQQNVKYTSNWFNNNNNNNQLFIHGECNSDMTLKCVRVYPNILTV